MNQQRPRIRRILVALDTSPHSHAALEAAANLAARLQAQLMGVYVEDMNLLRLAQLPFAHEIRYTSATLQKLDEVVVEKQLRSQASHARDALRQTAELHALEWSFRVLRGMVAAELLAAAAEADLLVLGRTSRQAGPHHVLGSTARSAVAQSQRSVLLMDTGFDLDQPPCLLYDGSEAAQRALQIAAAIARANGRLSVLLLTPDEIIGRQWQRDIQTQLTGDNLQIECWTVPDAVKLAAVLARMDVGLIVIGRTETPLLQAAMESLFQTGEQPVLIVQ